MPRNREIDRPLGFLEWVFWLLEQLSSVNIVVAADVSGPLTSDVLRQALDIVQAHQPLLRVRVAPGPRNRLWFVHDNISISTIPLRVIDVPRENWVEQSERELAQSHLVLRSARYAGASCCGMAMITQRC